MKEGKKKIVKKIDEKLEKAVESVASKEVITLKTKPCLLVPRATLRNYLGSQITVWFFTSCFLFPIAGEVKGVAQRFFSPESGKNKTRPCVNLKKEGLILEKIEEGNWF